MNQILTWSLSENVNLVFNLLQSDLGSITCCDNISIGLQVVNQPVCVLTAVSGCDLIQLKDRLHHLMSHVSGSFKFADILGVTKNIQGIFFIEVEQRCMALNVQEIASDLIVAWIKQLELLEILMEENEHEKNSRGKGCC